jgi:hypothetical protein
MDSSNKQRRPDRDTRNKLRNNNESENKSTKNILSKLGSYIY